MTLFLGGGHERNGSLWHEIVDFFIHNFGLVLSKNS